MPDPAVHASFGKEVLASLPPEIREGIVPEPYTFALFGPDAWFGYKPWIRREGRSRHMHTRRTGAFLLSLADHARASENGRAELFSYLAGFLCHYALDSTAHPYIIHITTEKKSFPRSHMSFEHTLDILQMERDGVWGEAHPVTDHYFPAVRLPASMRKDLDQVFEEVYGWKNCWKLLNRSLMLYRAFFRVMEKQKGLPSRVARVTGKHSLRSMTYSESQFLGTDAENLEHRPWNHSHDASQTYTHSFPELREQARVLAVRLISAAWNYIMNGTGNREDLAAVFGSKSYLSGLEEKDPRNQAVPSLLPPAEGDGSPGGPSC